MNVAVVGIGLLNRISIPMDIGIRPDLQLNAAVLTFTFGVTVP